MSKRRLQNANDFARHQADHYYGRSGGIEWDHEYYGARQFWADEWDTAAGWEHLCADPSSGNIPSLTAYIVSELPEASPPSTTPSIEQALASLSWLFEDEIGEIVEAEKRDVDTIEGSRLLAEKADLISADESGEEQETKPLASVPLGLKNRWRIWKVLKQIES